MALICLNALEGGGWLLVRLTRILRKWHPARDGLRGLDVYGDDKTNERSLLFRHLVTPETEVMLSIGAYAILLHFGLRFFFFSHVCYV
jgi:hypothetical protein